MPLKHTTETWLAVALACATVLTGFLMSTLPPLPAGAVPWAILMVFAVAYPVLLTPLFRRRRADTAFRLLHWAPALLLVLWLMAAGLSLFLHDVLPLLVVTWGWSLPFVTLILLALALFCIQVLRRWMTRLIMLGVILFLFGVTALTSEGFGLHIERPIGMVLWGGLVTPDQWIAWEGDSSSSSASSPYSQGSKGSTGSSVSTGRIIIIGTTNLSTVEQDIQILAQWAMSASSRPAIAQESSRPTVAQASSQATSAASSQPTQVAHQPTPPTQLPHAGPETEAILLSLMGITSARSIRRWQRMRIWAA